MHTRTSKRRQERARLVRTFREAGIGGADVRSAYAGQLGQGSATPPLLPPLATLTSTLKFKLNFNLNFNYHFKYNFN
jgi:hypothetical protein